MRCKHCLTAFHAETASTEIQFANSPLQFTIHGSRTTSYTALTQVCARCAKPHIALRESTTGLASTVMNVYPRGGPAAPAPAEVPSSISADYSEANEVIPISPKASAALSRRCLQSVLASAGYSDSSLAKQVQAAIDQTDASKALPPDIRDSLDAIRNFGNFSAHPITDITTSQIIDVEPGEAEWCLELLGELFEHFYVRPQRAARRREALNDKLAAAGKPDMKISSEARDPEPEAGLSTEVTA